MEKEDIINDIKRNLEAITSFDPNRLARSFDWGIGFYDLKQDFIKAIDNSRLLLKGFNMIDGLAESEQIVRLESILESISLLKNALQEVDTLVLRISQIETPSSGDRKLHNDPFARNNFNHALNRFLLETGYIRERIRLELENKLLSEEKEVKAVGQYITLFDDRIKSHRQASMIWLLLIVGISYQGFQIVSDMYINFSFDIAEDEYLKFIEHTSLKIILFALMVFIIHFAAKSYRLNKNQQIIYEDKKTALESYGYFINSSRDDKELHSAILLQVTNAIFAHRPNGYIDAKDEVNIGPVSEVLQLIKDTKSQ